jgi:malate dehydrogenase (oxaloacetate-decarboxylating)
MFGAINLEDIESPKVFEIFEQLQKAVSIPVFHDDRHGTSVVVLAALTNALRIVNKKIQESKIVIAGVGSAGFGIFEILHSIGCQDMIIADSRGVIYEGRKVPASNGTGLVDDNRFKREVASKTNPDKVQGSLADAIAGTDVFIGVSGKSGLLSRDVVASMNHDPVIFALSNPDPEIFPDDALNAGARIVATGRSDYPNQVNNAVVFPSLFRALLDARAKNIDQDLLVRIAYSIAGLINDNDLKSDFIVPKPNDPRILPAVIKALKPVRNIEKTG